MIAHIDKKRAALKLKPAMYEAILPHVSLKDNDAVRVSA
jgi:hypothetical protein